MVVSVLLVACAMVSLVRRRGGPPVAPRPPTPSPQSLEGALAIQLAGRVITREQYRRAMEFVAASDTGPESGATAS